MKTTVCLQYFVNGCFWKQFFASKLPQIPSSLISLTMFVTLRPITQFYTKLEANNLQKSTYNYFLNLFTDVGPNLILKAFQVWSGTVFRKIK